MSLRPLNILLTLNSKRDAFLIEIYQNLNSIGLDFVKSKLDCIRLFTKHSQSWPSFQNTNSTLIELAKLKFDHDRVLKNQTQQQWSLKMWFFFFYTRLSYIYES